MREREGGEMREEAVKEKRRRQEGEVIPLFLCSPLSFFKLGVAFQIRIFFDHGVSEFCEGQLQRCQGFIR